MRHLLCLTIALLPFAASADDFNCPEQIDVAPQTIAREIPGWRTFFDKTNNRYSLEQVSMYNGAPEELASLVPDQNSDAFSQWELPDNGKQKYFLTCSYDNTSVQLTRELPATLTSCRVTYAKELHNTNGSPTPMVVSCK